MGVLNLAGVYPGVLDDALLALCRVKAVAMLDWLALMSHPDGEISFFNDAAFGIAPSLADLVHYAEGIHSDRQPHPSPAVISAGKPDCPSIWLRDSGYVRLQAGPAVALLDCAPIGPDYLPGHAHADTLSFELSLFGQRVIVNGGTSRYGSGPERLAERGTAAHSTVQIDGVDSSEVWGGFRVARRARPFAVAVSHADGLVSSTVHPGVSEKAARGAISRTRGCHVTAAHDGYRRLPGTRCIGAAGV